MAHMAGIIAIPRIFEFVMLAQLAIGGAVGARLAQVRFAELRVYLRDAALTTVMILTLYFTAACLMTFVTGRDLLQIWLALSPAVCMRSLCSRFYLGLILPLLLFITQRASSSSFSPCL